MAQATAHPGPRRLAGLARASHLGLAASLGSKVEAGPPAPPSRVCSCAGGRRQLELQGPALGVRTHVSSELGHTLAGWHVQSGSHRGPLPPARAHGLPSACVKAGTYLHTRADTSVCSEEVSWVLFAKLCTRP